MIKKLLYRTAFLLLLSLNALAQRQPKLQVSGVFPHLALFNERDKRLCGKGDIWGSG